MINLIQARDLVNKDRLDLVVKYLYAKEFLESKNNTCSADIYRDLYIRHILMRTMGIEPDDIFGEKSNKNNIDKFIQSFQELIISIKENGYDNNHPIPVCSGLLANGAHRVAAATLLNQKVSVITAEQGFSWNFDWFCHNGFNTEDKQRILKGFIDINYDKCAIFVIWNPLFKYMGNVKAVINRYFDIVGDVDLDFEDNYIAFTNILLEIYEPNISKNNDETVIREKAKLLQANYLNFKVIVVTNQDKNVDKSISELSKNCKNDIRKLFDHLLPKECFCTVHSSDCKEETQYLANVLLSPNNIKHLKYRLNSNVDSNFVQVLRNLPKFLESNQIQLNDICIIGTGVLSALGIQDIHKTDLDFIIDEKYRRRFGWKACPLSQEYEIGISSKEAKGPINDNIIIHNDDYHFWFKGIKFANLQIIKDRKSSFAREKDKIHYRQIELFEKMIGKLEQFKILKKRIEYEQQRRKQAIPLVQANSKVHYSNLLERIFSVKNEISNSQKYKVLTVVGIKIKFKRRYK